MILLLLLVAQNPTAVGETTAASLGPAASSSSSSFAQEDLHHHVLDLSYQHKDLGAGVRSPLADAIRGYVDSEAMMMVRSADGDDNIGVRDHRDGDDDEQQTNDGCGALEIDVSSSIDGDDAFREIVDALFCSPGGVVEEGQQQPSASSERNTIEKTTEETSVVSPTKVDTTPTFAIHLKARMNQLTPKGATYLIQSALSLSTTNATTGANTTVAEPHEAGTTKATTTSFQCEQDAHVSTASSRRRRSYYNFRLESLDLGWNFLSPAAAGNTNFFKALQRLVTSGEHCPSVLRLDRCGLGPAVCRAIGKGIMHRYNNNVSTNKDKKNKDKNGNDNTDQKGVDIAAQLTARDDRPLSLHLCGNPAVGDAGAAALAAALKTVITSWPKEGASSSKQQQQQQEARQDEDSDSGQQAEGIVILENLDLSACDIGDVGVEALALALESAALLPRGSGGRRTPCVLLIRHLDLSNNHRITDRGMVALCNALTAGQPGSSAILESLDVGGNTKIGDRGACAIAGAVAKGCLPAVSLRSCNVYATGAGAMGKALRTLTAHRGENGGRRTGDVGVAVDLSGNPLGVLRPKSKKSDKYSASRLKSKATATASSYMNFLNKNIKDAVGVDVAQMLKPTVDSDDDEEEREALAGLGGEVESNDPSKAACGIKALVAAFLNEDEEGEEETKGVATGGATDEPAATMMTSGRTRLEIGLRRCFLDHSAADALAAILVATKRDNNDRDELFFENVDLSLDVRLNPVLEEDMVEALQQTKSSPSSLLLLEEMAERHTDQVEALREARKRAARAVALARERAAAEAKLEAAWADRNRAAPDYEEEEDEGGEEEWDSSDADYDDAYGGEDYE